MSPTLFLRDTPDHAPSANHDVLVNLFLAMQTIGLVGSIALVLTTTLSTRASRNATWQNFFTSWIVSTTSYSLLLFSGQAHKANPTFGICLAQAGLVYGIPSLTAGTTFGLIAQIWFITQGLLKHKVKHERLYTLIILTYPYVVLFGLVMASWVEGARDQSEVVLIGSGMYCHLKSNTLGKVSAAIVAITLLPTLALQVSICVALRRNWSAFRRMKHAISITIRVIIFTMFGILAIGLSGIFIFSESHGAALNIVIASMPVVAVVVFSSQRDIIGVWMFWKPHVPTASDPVSSSSSYPPAKGSYVDSRSSVASSQV